ncbi:MAG: porin [Cupriavidus necator]
MKTDMEMKRAMLARCVLVAAVAFGAGGHSIHAAAQSSSVNLYGVADVGLVHENGAAAGSVTKVTSGMMSGSRVGMRGREELGGGTAAFFTLEAGILMDTGASGQGGLLFGRQAYVGLDASPGRITMGRQYTTLALAQVEFDPFVTGLAGTSANLISAGGRGGSNRVDNALKYNLPGTLGGLDGELSYSFGEVPGGAATNSQFGASLGYSGGNFMGRVAYADAHDANGPGKNAREVFFGAKYDFGLATGYLNYVINRGAIVPGTPNFKSEDVLVGASIPVGAGRVVTSYIYKNDRTDANNDAHQFAIGYVHNLSKRTRLYTSYAHIWNRAANTARSGFYRVWNANDVGNPLAGNSAFNVGINHAF